MRGFFITGTDTNVGKTIVSALLLHHFAKILERMLYIKAIQTGIESECDASLVQKIMPEHKACRAEKILALRRPLSPHLAAYYANEHINLTSLVHQIRLSITKNGFVLVEGAGGVLVPINQRYLMIDLIKAIELKALLVARSGLGTINHTLLSLEALRARNIAIQGVIMVGEPNKDNESSVSFYGQIPVLAVPLLPLINQENMAKLAHDLSPKLGAFFKHHD